ncbi:hypothetical protein AAHE18_19G173400 [Arachis hypogaea]|uniref:Uncharacterized protein n=1 Tax=Arachis hypogaea TaxID=3818 RepID=A0A6B9VE31_ARAHY|nr:uncharacterized protein DS421_19g662110 [Arachis hypogaea]
MSFLQSEGKESERDQWRGREKREEPHTPQKRLHARQLYFITKLILRFAKHSFTIHLLRFNPGRPLFMVTKLRVGFGDSISFVRSPRFQAQPFDCSPPYTNLRVCFDSIPTLQFLVR